jgi:hypothetical protein
VTSGRVESSMSVLWETVSPPTAAGGTGGSGTRVITEVLSSAGVFMGSRLNRAGDALEIADFDWRWGKPYLAAELAGEPPPLARMQDELPSSLRDHLEGFDANVGAWGWKHPHAYLLLPWLDTVIPRLRFVHLVRDGRRVARSRNQKQQLHYSELVFGAAADAWDEQLRAIRFWSWANARAADYGERNMGERYLRLRFEDFCEQPQATCRALIAFALDGVAPSEEAVTRAAGLVRTPPALEPEPAERAQLIEQGGLDGLRRFGYL